MKNFDLTDNFAKCEMNEQYLTSNGWVFVITGKHYVNPDGTFWHVTITAPDGETRNVETKGNTIKGWFKKLSFGRVNKGTGNGAKGTPPQNNGTTKRISVPKNGVKLLSYNQMDIIACQMCDTYQLVCRCIERNGGTPNNALIASGINDYQPLTDVYHAVNRYIKRYHLNPYLSIITHLQRKQRLTLTWARRKARYSIEYKKRLTDAQARLTDLNKQIADAFINNADAAILEALKTSIIEQTALVEHLTKHIQ